MIPCYIDLYGGDFALCDHDDYEMLSKFRWCKSDRGYAKSSTGHEKNHSFMHRFLMLPDPDQYVDHINHDPLDNRRCNLRVVSPQESSFNTRGCPSKKYSRYKGVQRQSEYQLAGGGKSIGPNPWFASLTVGSDRFRSPGLPTEEAAALAYNDMAREHQGEHAYLNEVKR